MRNPVFGTMKLAETGTIVIDGSAQYTTLIFPRTIGALIIPEKTKAATATLSCEIQKKGSLNNKEGLMHTLHEGLIARGQSTLYVEDFVLPMCTPLSVDFTEVRKDFFRFNVVFEIGKQNDYDDPEKVTYVQKANYPGIGSTRIGRFSVKDRTDFILGQQVEQLKGADYEIQKTLKNSWSWEYNHVMAGGVEKIKVNGWIVNSTHTKLLNFIYNALFGPMGFNGTLTVGNNETKYAFFKSISMQPIKTGTMRWNAEFVTSLKC